jgi:hypothetical protein
MVVLAAVGGGAFVLSSFVLGLRLAWLARRTRGLPELVLGLGLFFMAGLGYPFGIVGLRAEALPTAVRIAFVVCNMVFLGAGMSGVAFFTHRVFHPGSRSSAAAVAGIAGAFAACLGAQALGPGFEDYLTNTYGPWRQSMNVSIVCSTWAGVEALRYWWMLRRRQRVGLADPVVSDRFRLWATAMLTASLISITSMVLESLGIQMMGTAMGACVVGPLGLVISASLWLAFLPPAAYLRRIRARAAARAAPDAGLAESA